MVKTEVSARVSSWLFFLNRSELIGKRGNIPSGERVAGWRKWGDVLCPGRVATLQRCCAEPGPSRRALVARWAPALQRIAKKRCAASGARAAERNPKGVLPVGTSDFSFYRKNQFYENNPMHSRTVVDFKQEIRRRDSLTHPTPSPVIKPHSDARDSGTRSPRRGSGRRKGKPRRPSRQNCSDIGLRPRRRRSEAAHPPYRADSGSWSA